MTNPSATKLAPMLSAEERYKIIVPDLHRELAGEKPLISESERQAITHFDNRMIWQEYTQKICMMQWAQTLWPKDIEAEKLRVVAFSLCLNHAVERALLDGDKSLPKAKRAAQFAKVKEYVVLMGEQSVTLYAHRDALEKIREELYGIPLFNEQRMGEIIKNFETVDWLIERHNESICNICGYEISKKYIKPMVQDIESYLVKKPSHDSELVERMVDEMRQIAASETRMLGR